MNNILLIVIDCLREDMVREKYMPFLHSLKKKGIYFNNVYAQSSWTKTSIASIMTGLFPFEHNVHTIADKLPDNVSTLAEHLVKKGYDTFYATSNPYLWKGTGFEKGFVDSYCHNVADSDLINEGLGYASQSNDNWFLYLHLMTLHPPYSKGMDYEKSVKEVDSILEAYLGDDLYLFKDRAVIITADHGYGFGEHGIYGHNPGLYNELIKVPLLVISPYGWGGKENSYHNLKMIYDVILTQSISCEDEIIYSERWNTSQFQRIQCIIKEDWKLIYYSPLNKWDIMKKYIGINNKTLFKNILQGSKNVWRRRKISSKYNWELYNLKNDPSENVNRIEEGVIYWKLKEQMQNLINSSGQYQTGKVKYTDEQIERLKYLGYL